jgi:hypothetical protein
MKTLSVLFPFAIGLGLMFSPTVAHADTFDHIAEDLFIEANEFLGIEIEDTELLALLMADLEYAIAEELIDSSIVDEIEDAISSDREPDVGSLYEENEAEQEQSWLEQSPELLNAFDLIKFEFHQCRAQSTGGASQCAQGLGFKLQAASVQLALEKRDQQMLALDRLEGAERQEALASIASQEGRLTEKLARAEQRLARFGEDRDGSVELQTAVSEARGAGITDNNNGRGNPSSGNQDNNANPGSQGNNANPGNRGNNANQGNQGGRRSG